MSENKPDSQTKEKLSIVGVIMLIIAILVFSGIFSDAEGPLQVVDFSNLQGAFGKITEGSNFKGSGGTSAKEGFLFALTLAPTVMVAMGLIQIFENYGALKAAERLLTPIMKPILGIPGQASLALVGSLSSSDAGSAMTRELYDAGKLTEDERDILQRSSIPLQASSSITSVEPVRCSPLSQWEQACLLSISLF